jgi:predicted phosphoribosyltransferase
VGVTTFTDRDDAGRRLAAAVANLVPAHDVVVVGLPRGGVPVAAVVASALDAPLDVLLVRKVGHPRHREFAIGAVAEGGIEVMDESAMQQIGPDTAAAAVDRARRELQERAERYRGSRPAHALGGRTVVIVDDGLATGATMRSAVRAAEQLGAARVVVAVPVASPRGLRTVEGLADQVVCLAAPVGFRAVGQYYDDFAPTTDDDVRRLLGA